MLSLFILLIVAVGLWIMNRKVKEPEAFREKAEYKVETALDNARKLEEQISELRKELAALRQAAGKEPTEEP